MRISMVVAQAASDDGDRTAQVAELSAALALDGHEVVVHTRRDDPDAPARKQTEHGVTIVQVDAGPPRGLPMDEVLAHLNDFGTVLARDWRSLRPDVVHAHFWPAGLVSLLAARELDVPVVQTFHTHGPVTPHLERLVARRVDRIAATCSEEMFDLLRTGVRRPRVSVVPYGVDLLRFAPGDRVVRQGERYRVLCVGRSLAHEDHEVAIAALARIPNTELVITGGPDRSALAENVEAGQLRELAKRRGVADRLKLVGRVSPADMPALLRSADLVLCLPRQVSLGTVPLEAMACGLPVVTGVTGPLSDLVVDGVTGRHVPPRDPVAIAEIVRHLLASPVVREAYGASGRDRVQSRYSWDRIALDTVDVYQRAAASC